MSPDHELSPKDTGMCPHGNFKDGTCELCKNEELGHLEPGSHLNKDEVEQESKRVHSSAVFNKAKEVAIEHAKQFPELWQRIRAEDQKRWEEAEKIESGRAEQPTAINYNDAERSVELAYKNDEWSSRNLKEGVEKAAAKRLKKRYGGEQRENGTPKEETAKDSQKNHTKWSQERAMEYVGRGELKQAIDSMVSDLAKEENRP